MSGLGSRAQDIRRGGGFAAVLVLLGCIGSGCATVSPYERGYLSRPSMDLVTEEGETSFRAHVHDSREGSTGGHGSTGGGCGCN